MTTEQNASFTGRRRTRKTKPGVHLTNAFARWLITFGGIVTIVSVLLVCFFLVWVVIPLFLPPSLSDEQVISIAGDPSAGEIVHADVDEYQTIAFQIARDGSLTVNNLIDGSSLNQEKLFADRSPVCWAFSLGSDDCAVGFADGTIVTGTIAFETTYVDEADAPELASLVSGEKRAWQGGIVERTQENQLRAQLLAHEFSAPIELAAGVPIVLIDLVGDSSDQVLTALTADGLLQVARVERRENLLTGEETVDLSEGSLQISDEGFGLNPPRWLKLSGLGDNAYIAWEDGRLLRVDTRDIAAPHIAEMLDLVDEKTEKLTSLEFLLGKATLISGDSAGRVNAWFRIITEDSPTLDGTMLVKAHEMPRGPAAVTTLRVSERTRKVAAGYADGAVHLFHVTSKKLLAAVAMPADETKPVSALVISAKDDGLFAIAGNRISSWFIDAPHPETTLSSIFLPVWYEGYAKPEHVWQSSSGTDDFEPKYGMMPLIFGTIKATLYSMLFGAPLALLAAIFTSEFLSPRAKSAIKPTIELMASLPSVVLGFLSALIFAPFIEKFVPEAILGVFMLPMTFLLGAYLWQLIPPSMTVKMASLRLPAMALGFPLGLWLAIVLGDPFEQLFFSGDIKAWLDGQIGSGWGGWVLILLPLSGLIVAFLIGNLINPWLRSQARNTPSQVFAGLDLAKFLAAVALTLIVATMLGWILTTIGLDPRGGFMDTYVQRNAMVVGFIMGFAIIPIIYTISEDALSAVPEHLRAGSLGAGATPWQTAVRIIIPTAMSGLFSALMIGLGRAVGETMIVLMAAGNTPVMDWNIFNGFRTLSANIAVELPEAVQNSTHYRTLFLAALALFVMTFLVNTVAEMVRQRFRRRSSQL